MSSSKCQVLEKKKEERNKINKSTSFLFRFLELMMLLYRFQFFLFFELTHIQVVIETLLREQFIMFAALDDLSVLQHQNHIGVADGG